MPAITDGWLATTFDPAHLSATLDDLASAQQDEEPAEAVALRDDIAACARKISQYRAALDTGGDPSVVGQWITETQARKLAAETRLRARETMQERRVRAGRNAVMRSTGRALRS